MQTRYSDEKPFEGGPSIFLGGPTPRVTDVPSWRPQALQIIEATGFTGTVLIPERRDWSVKFDYTDQVEWEYQGLTAATVKLFWVPRSMKTMPALTTNAEFALWLERAPQQVVYGRPVSADSIRYLDWLFNKLATGTIHDSLESTAKAAVSLVDTINNR